MERYTKFVVEAEEGITFETSKGTKGELIIRAQKQGNEGTHVKCAKPPIPDGYKYVHGKWHNGYVIERYSDRSQFTWIPVGILEPSGILSGMRNEKIKSSFGRRNYRDNEFSLNGFNESMNYGLAVQLDSIEKYGGFYISSYALSKSEEGKPQSIRGKMPWTNVTYAEAKAMAASMENTESVKTHLFFGAEYDTVLEWLIKSKAKTMWEVIGDSYQWGNFKKGCLQESLLQKTGSSEKYCTNNIYDFAGNIEEWTQESYKASCKVTRGGSFRDDGGEEPVAFRYIREIEECGDEATGFRAALWLA